MCKGRAPCTWLRTTAASRHRMSLVESLDVLSPPISNACHTLQLVNSANN